MAQKRESSKNAHHPVPPTARGERIGGRPMRLPFQPKRRRGGVAEWIYRHRVGLLITIVIYLSLLITFVTYKIVVNPNEEESIEVNIDEMKIIEELLREQQLNEMLNQQQDGGKVSNKISNQDSKYDETLRDSKNTDVDKMNEEIEALQQKLLEGQKSQQESLDKIDRDAAALREELKRESNVGAKSGDRDQDAFVKGNVVASFSLEGRTCHYMDIPAYLCENGGVVVVNISVNRNGKVIAASVERSASSSDNCLQREAESSAMACQFNTSASAPEPQRGTITYTFVAQ